MSYRGPRLVRRTSENLPNLKNSAVWDLQILIGQQIQISNILKKNSDE